MNKTRGHERVNAELGLTKREHFASMATQGLLSNSTSGGLGDISTLSICAVDASEALIKALNKNSD